MLQTLSTRTRFLWYSRWMAWMTRISLTLEVAFLLAMNLTANRAPALSTASHTSANPPRPRSWTSFRPGIGSLPAWMRGRLTRFRSGRNGDGRIVRTVAHKPEASGGGSEVMAGAELTPGTGLLAAGEGG